MIHKEIETLEELDRHLAEHGNLSNTVIQSLDLTHHKERLRPISLADTVFLGCKMTPKMLGRAVNAGAMIFPVLENFPFNPYRNKLYSPDELVGHYQPVRRLPFRYF